MFSTWGGDFISSFVDESQFFILAALPEKCCLYCFPNKNPQNCEVQAKKGK